MNTPLIVDALNGTGISSNKEQNLVEPDIFFGDRSRASDDVALHSRSSDENCVEPSGFILSAGSDRCVHIDGDLNAVMSRNVDTYDKEHQARFVMMDQPAILRIGFPKTDDSADKRDSTDSSASHCTRSACDDGTERLCKKHADAGEYIVVHL